ncbi:hypothetical protein NPS01_12770 [Nocardioides psychrotolerans]|uniref:Uncharacterized protein n=1 Tax=Nocardioides psychrotolerans TaxID=1005945 RepID=A0A1I3HG84_9ACTN|nr:hypothetical protein [Nocardioides psychrotolerans]GEP37614.1 hypothetical protein NPS01_12770 [Nocardioides psychrotolerans]SFI34619.1 hypothetical protein SAMN05216561_107167 [Nocardioides psychrotolerans]
MSEHENESDLGPKPDAQIEPGEPNPGGVDATPNSDGVDGEAADGQPLGRDAEPEDNPAVEDALPDEVKEGEDTSTEATEATESPDEENTGAADDADRENPA